LSFPVSSNSPTCVYMSSCSTSRWISLQMWSNYHNIHDDVSSICLWWGLWQLVHPVLFQWNFLLACLHLVLVHVAVVGIRPHPDFDASFGWLQWNVLLES
jgi:hypothetical protein